MSDTASETLVKNMSYGDEQALLLKKLDFQEKTESFGHYFNEVASIMATNARIHGFYDVGHSKGDLIALMHSELSEMLEAVRTGDPQSEKIPEFTNEAEELADLVIRAMDYARRNSIPLPEAIIAKAKYNVNRPFKHGKSM